MKIKQINKPLLNPALFNQTQAPTYRKKLQCGFSMYQKWKEELSDSVNALTDYKGILYLDTGSQT